MPNINLHWFEEVSERLNIDIDLDLKKDIVYWQKCNSVLIVVRFKVPWAVVRFKVPWAVVRCSYLSIHEVLLPHRIIVFIIRQDLANSLQIQNELIY